MSERTGPGRAAPWVAWLLALVSGLVAFLLPLAQGAALLPLALACHLAAAALALGHAPEPGLGRLLLRRLPVVLCWILLAQAGSLLLGGWPLWLLGQDAGLGAVLLLCLALTLVWVGLWRNWPLFALALVETPKRRGGWALFGHGWRETRRLVAADPSSGRGLLAALLALLLLVGSPALLWALADAALAWRGGAGLAWSLLLAPALSYVLLALVEPARLAAAKSEPVAPPGSGPRSDQPPPRPQPPTLLPGDPTARLLVAARLGRSEDAIAALDQGADPQALPGADERDQRTLAMLASVLPDTRLLRRLIAAGVDLNRRHAGLTALLAATRDSLRGRPDAVMTLLANGADPRATDAEGRTPLHFAALVAEPDVAALLLDAGAPIDAANRDGYAPLGVACATGNWRLARFLLDRRARIEPTGAQSALLAAAGGEDDPVGVQLLLRHKARVDARGRLGRTAMLNAALAGNVRIVEALLDAGADPDLADDHGVTPLLEAARAGANGVLALLPAGRIRVDAADHSGRNALVLACQSQRSDPATIEQLLALGVDPAQAAADGRTAAACALAQHRWPLLRVLDPATPVPAAHAEPVVEVEHLQAAVAEDPRPWPVRLDEALCEHDLFRVDAVLRDARPAPDELFELLLLRGGELGDDAQCRLLATLPLAWIDASAALARAVAQGRTGLVRGLRRRGASAGGIALASWLRASREHAPAADSEWVALELLVVGGDGFALADGDPALLLAVRFGMHRLARALLLRGVDPDQRDRCGRSALHWAAAAGDEHAVALLLRFGARIDGVDREGCSPCGLALRHGRAELRDWLDWRGWQLPARRLRDADLVAAAASGDAAAVERLLALGLAVDASDAQGATALIRAAGGGHLASVRALIAAGANLRRAAHGGATALSAALSMRQRGVVEALLDAGASLDPCLPGGVTPLMLAAALGADDMLGLLLERGADPMVRDERGNLAVHALAQFGFAARDRERVLACWRALLASNPACADAPAADGVTPLLLLLGARADSGHAIDQDCLNAQLEELLRHQPDLARRESRGFTALHLCALHGQLAALRRLLQAGADREARDQLDRRPQEIATLRGFVDLAAELGPLDSVSSPPSMAQFLRGPGR